MEDVGLAATEWLMDNLDKYSFTDRFLHALTLFPPKHTKRLQEIKQYRSFRFCTLHHKSNDQHTITNEQD